MYLFLWRSKAGKLLHFCQIWLLTIEQFSSSQHRSSCKSWEKKVAKIPSHSASGIFHFIEILFLSKQFVQSHATTAHEMESSTTVMKLGAFVHGTLLFSYEGPTCIIVKSSTAYLRSKYKINNFIPKYQLDLILNANFP